MSELTTLKNIGPAMEESLTQAGITTIAQLEELGAVEAFLKLKQVRPRSCKMTLYALYGALHDMNCIQLDPDIKKMLGDMLEDAS